jgi:monofunctional biosynthetic peptidoglycan transglycosylase
MLRFLFALVISIVSFLVLIVLGAAWVLISTPRPSNIKGCFTTEMYHVHLCPKDASYTSIREIPHGVKMAVIVSEDGSFYDHHGFDWFELKQSIKKDLKTGHFSRGGSTITQQLAKNLYLNKEKSLFRKLREAIIASQIEDMLDKEEILEKYFNVVEFGPKIYGIQAGAKFYFNKKVSELTIAEGAWLAMLLPNPTKNYQSFRKGSLSPFARKEITTTIKRLVAFKKITQDSADQALMEMDVLFSNARVEPKDIAEPRDEDSRESNQDSDDESWF